MRPAAQNSMVVPHITFKVSGNKLLLEFSGVGYQIERAISKGLTMGGKLTVLYIREKLLSGQMLDERTGRLKKGIYSQARNNSVKIGIRSTVKHGFIQHKGVNHPWVIRPKERSMQEGRTKHWKTKKWLVWQRAGEYHFARETHPKGLKSRKFLFRGLKEMTPAIAEVVRKYIMVVINAYKANRDMYNNPGAEFEQALRILDSDWQTWGTEVIKYRR